MNLTNALSAYLTFECKWAIETWYDYSQIKILTDNGSTWTALCGKYTKPGTTNQASGEPLYDGRQKSWVKEEMALDNFIGHNVLFQYSLVSDAQTNWDGFYFDDFKVYAMIDSTSAVQEYGLPSCYISNPMPNPSTEETAITFNIPQTANDAFFELTDMTGRIVFSKKIGISNGVIKINSSS